jgi:hypothetical protein
MKLTSSKGKNRLRMFEKRVLRRTFGRKREGVTVRSYIIILTLLQVIFPSSLLPLWSIGLSFLSFLIKDGR